MLVFSLVFGGPGGFRKVQEVYRKNFLLFSSRSDFMVSSYVQKAKLSSYTKRFQRPFQGFRGVKGFRGTSLFFAVFSVFS